MQDVWSLSDVLELDEDWIQDIFTAIEKDKVLNNLIERQARFLSKE